MRYDAFISYRHGELDGIVAEKLHKMLETYRIPNAIAKKIGKKRLSRVFRDREELPTSSNLSDSINDALENSEFLLLICSRRTCQSQWVMREVERFGELQGKDKIITLLIDGEPDESFPPGLRERKVGDEIIFVEPLAADIRAETWAGSIKLLKEEKLRLLAPLLGCAFDDLRRRHLRRRVQRIAAVVGFTLLFSCSFGGFSAYQYMRIEQQMQLKLENQSYVLAEYSEAQLEAGDPEMALLLAMKGLPENLEDPERPLVSAPEEALADALGIYDLTDGFKHHKMLNLPVAPSKLTISSSGKYAAAIYPFELILFDMDNGERLYTLPTVRSALADTEFISDSVIVYASEEGIEAFDIVNNTSLWKGENATAIAVSERLIAAVYKDADEAVLYTANGEIYARISFNGKTMSIPTDDTFLNSHDTLFELSGDGSLLAVSFSDESLSLFDTRTGANTSVYSEDSAIHFSGGFSANTLAFAAVCEEPYQSVVQVYNSSGEKITAYESETSRLIPFVSNEGVFFAIENQIMRVDSHNGEASFAAAAGGKIEAFAQKGGEFLICESSGAYRFVGTGGMKEFKSDYTCHFPVIGDGYALTGSYDAKSVRIMRRETLSELDVMTYDSSYDFSEAKIHQDNGRIVFYSYRGFRICDMDGKVLTEATIPDPMEVLNTEYDKQSGNIVFLFKDKFMLYSGKDGSLLLEKSGKTAEYKDNASVLYTKFGVSLLSEDGTATLYNLSTGEEISRGYTEPEADSALPVNGGLLIKKNKEILFVQDRGLPVDGLKLGEGSIIGIGLNEDAGYYVAIADETEGKAFTINSGGVDQIFRFDVQGTSEAYFSGGFMFLSPLHGDTKAYRLDNGQEQKISKNGFLTEVDRLGDYVTAGYVSSSNERYTFLLDRETLETVAQLPGFLGELEDLVLIFDTGGALRAQQLYSLKDLTDMAGNRLNGRELTPEELDEFKAW